MKMKIQRLRIGILFSGLFFTTFQETRSDEQVEVNQEQKKEGIENNNNILGLNKESIETSDIIKLEEDGVENEEISKLKQKGVENTNPVKLKEAINAELGYDYTEEEMTKFKIWPKGIIPYFIDDLSFDIKLRTKIRAVLDFINVIAGLGFSELPYPPSDDDDERWVFFINRRGQLGCTDYTTNDFTNKGVQQLVLGYDCLNANVGDLAGFVLALVGVPPQHNAPNRDDYISVNTEVIIPEKRQLFDILGDGDWLFHNVPYDFMSAGHYSFHKYTVNGSATIVPLPGRVNMNLPIGEGGGLSKIDVWKIRMMYNYISLNKNKPKESDCAKLYEPGKELKNYKPKLQDNVVPREKPSEYLNSNGNGGKKDSKTDDAKHKPANGNTESQEREIVTSQVNQGNKPELMRKKSSKIKKGRKDKLDFLLDFNSDDYRRKQAYQMQNKNGHYYVKKYRVKKY